MHLRYSFFMVFCFLFSKTSWSQNCGYLPGDAFFGALVNEETIFEAFDDVLLFNEGGVDRVGSFGGYIGFHRLGLECEPNVVINKIKIGLKRLREEAPHFDRVLTIRQDADGNDIARNLTSAVLMVYSKDFNCLKYPIGLRFNEGWVDTSDDVNIRNARSGYNSEWNSRASFVFDMVNAKEVRSLDGRHDGTSDTRVRGARSKETIRTRFEEAKLVIVPESFFRQDFNNLVSSCHLSVTYSKNGIERDEVVESDCDVHPRTWVEITSDALTTVTVGDGPLKRFVEPYSEREATGAQAGSNSPVAQPD